MGSGTSRPDFKELTVPQANAALGGLDLATFCASGSEADRAQLVQTLTKVVDGLTASSTSSATAASATSGDEAAEGSQAATAGANDISVTRIVMTGGPCGGKSSSLKHLTEAVKGKGMDVYCVPEVPTILISGGAAYPGVDGGDKLMAFETALIQAQLQLEESFIRIAKSTGRPAVVVCDRGLLDIAAYLPPAQWELILEANELTVEGVARRYDLVLHLVTAADGAEQFYTRANNAARTETAEEARALDSKIKRCYDVHHNLRVVGNSSDFKGKLEEATKHVLEVIS